MGDVINHQDLEGKTAMIYLVNSSIYVQRKLKIIKLFLKNHADPNIQDNTNDNCLTYVLKSARIGDLNKIELLKTITLFSIIKIDYFLNK